MDDLARLGLRLRTARERQNISQSEAADALKLPRTAVTNIESGTRSVSTLELTKFASLYRVGAGSLLEEHPGNVEDFSIALPRALQDVTSDPNFHKSIQPIVDLCTEGATLRRLLGRDLERTLPDYSAKVTSTGDAIRHAETVALDERRRLGLGTAPVGNIAELIGSQGIWVSAFKLPEGMSGLFLNADAIGSAVLVHEDHGAARRRFSYAHEYGHALFDHKEIVRVTERSNASDLIEKRANAFAAAFLMPASGMAEQLRRLDKGQPSRQAQFVYDVANDKATESEIRPRTGSQAITFQDVRSIARHFGVSYESAAWRLKSLGHIGSEVQTLLAQKGKSEQLEDLMKTPAGHAAPPPDTREQQLSEQLARLVIEAYRQGEISQGRVRDLAKKLQVDSAGLLDLAETARAG